MNNQTLSNLSNQPVKRILVVRKDLNISLGKWMSQVAHVARRFDLQDDYSALFNNVVIIAKYVKSESKLLSLKDALKAHDIRHSLQRDGGKNEVKEGSPTCLFLEATEASEELTKRLQLVKGNVLWQ